MKPKRKLINIVQHKMTGAQVPMEIKKVHPTGIIEEYKEVTKERYGYNFNTLKDKWGLDTDSLIDLLNKYQVPAHLDHQQLINSNHIDRPIEIAFFFKEYIDAIEKKEKMKIKKVKAKLFSDTLRE